MIPAGELDRRLLRVVKTTPGDVTTRGAGEDARITAGATIAIATRILGDLATTTVTVEGVEVRRTHREMPIARERTRVGREGERNSEIGTSVRRIGSVMAIRVSRRAASGETSAGGVVAGSADSRHISVAIFAFIPSQSCTRQSVAIAAEGLSTRSRKKHYAWTANCGEI